METQITILVGVGVYELRLAVIEGESIIAEDEAMIEVRGAIEILQNGFAGLL